MTTLTPAKIEELAYNAGMSVEVNKHGNTQFRGFSTELERLVNMVQVKVSSQGCTRSHPHENMSVECALKAEIAGLKAELRRVKDKWQEDYLLLNDVCTELTKLQLAAKEAKQTLLGYKPSINKFGLLFGTGQKAIDRLTEAGVH